MAGIAVRRTAFFQNAYVPAIHAFCMRVLKTWMPGTRPGMTGRILELRAAA
jgi:hypothetical protein